jgi:hypothetical protein
MITYKGHVRNRSWPNLRYYSGIPPDRLSETTKDLRIVGNRAEI